LVSAVALLGSAAVAAACGSDESDSAAFTATATTASASATPQAVATDSATRTLPAGTHTSQQFAIPFTLSVPAGWEVMVDNPDIFAIEHPRAADAPFAYIVFMVPEQAYEPAESGPVLAAAPTDFAHWLSNHRLLNVVGTGPATLGGLTGTRVDIATNDPFGGFPLFKLSDGDFDVRFRDRFAFVVLNRAQSQVLVSYGSDLPVNFEAAEALTQAVLATVSFQE
jgi:hypothetical protein